MQSETQIAYYKEYNFNPVPINVESPLGWKSQLAKRRNLYEAQLGIPVSLFNRSDVLEFGCNSGENALVLASFGANLTLVEPNDQVLPRLESLFTQFDLKDRIYSLIQSDMDSFRASKTYDVVLAEGFLYNLPDRDLQIRRLSNLLAPSGLGVITFIDRYGSLVEWTKRLILWRACYLSGVLDPRSEDCLNLARKLYGDDFAQIAASRPFDSWWQDSMIWTNHKLWSYQEILPLIQEADCEFYSTSPKWEKINHFNWHKNVYTPTERYRLLMQNWEHAFPFFLTGFLPTDNEIPLPSLEVLQAVSNVVSEISEYTTSQVSDAATPAYPAELHKYLSNFVDEGVNQFNTDMERIYQAARGDNLENLVTAYHRCDVLRKCWGSAYHYVCFVKAN